MTLEEQIEALHKAQMHYEKDIHKEGNMTNYTPVEKNNDEYASKATAGAALGFGIGGTVLSLLQQNGGLGGLLGGCGCGRQQYITREEAALQSQLSAKDSEIALLKADKYTDQKLIEVYEKLQAQINAMKEGQYAVNLQQATLNATQSATISCIQQNLANLKGQFDSLTHLSIPNSSICPGWGNVTITPSTAATTTAA